MDYRDDLGYAAEPPYTSPEDSLRPLDDAMQYLRQYAKQKPEVIAFACFGIGFILGWKLKPW
jgi:hypothetical protein